MRKCKHRMHLHHLPVGLISVVSNFLLHRFSPNSHNFAFNRFQWLQPGIYPDRRDKRLFSNDKEICGYRLKPEGVFDYLTY